MNYNQQVQGYKCDDCSRLIPIGEEYPRYTYDDTNITNQLFCRICKISRGHDLAEPYSNLGFNPEKGVIAETPEFKRYIEDKEFSKNTKELAKRKDDSQTYDVYLRQKQRGEVG